MKQLILFLILFTYMSVLFAQRIPENEYMQFIPLGHPPLVRQALGSAELLLYGDKSSAHYRDVDPADGIDDSRARVLMKLAAQFSPILIQNSFAVPMDFRKFTDHGASYLLYVDEWNLAGPEAELMRSYTIDILNLNSRNSLNPVSDSLWSASNDELLLSLLRQFHPENPSEITYRKAAVDPMLRTHKVLYVDFPGSDIESWQAEYVSPSGSELKKKYRKYLKAYVHPFIHRVESNTSGLLGYELVLQYYLFYPFNDGANNHIGDWEHLNVVISPLSRLKTTLNRDEMQQILENKWNEKQDPLVIKRVEAYFHHNVFVLDYSSPNVYKPRDLWKKEMDSMPERMIDEKKLWKKIRDLAYEDENETKINTHPIAYIGGDSKGLDLLLVSPGGHNQNSHGTFPFPGIYKNVGPGGATEQIAIHFDHNKYFNTEKREKFETFKRGGLLSFNNLERLELIPDWENIIDLVHRDSRLRQKWYWMLLPLHWGYPAVESPFAGIVDHADTGNLSPHAPWYQGSWNRSGATKGHALYEPHSYYLFLPLGFTDTFQNNFGFLNVTFPLFVHVPPLDIGWFMASSPLQAFSKQQNPLYYPTDSVPFRFFSIMPGITRIYLADDFTDLLINKKQGTSIINYMLAHITEYYNPDLEIVNASENIDDPVALVLDATVEKGRLSVQNSLIHSRSAMNLSVKFNNIPDLSLSTDLNMWQYEGSVRINISKFSLQPFVRLGYGYTWYRLENTSANGEEMERPKSNWFNKPFTSGNYFPNSFVTGLGFEWVFIKSMGKLPKGIDISAKIEFDWKWHKLGLNVSEFNINDLLEIGYLAKELPEDKLVRHELLRGGLVFSF